MAPVRKTVSLKHILDEVGPSRGILRQLLSWCGFDLSAVSCSSRSVGAAWPGALQLIGTIRENDFPVHIPSEQLLFKYFPYSSFTGKQYLIEIS